MSAPVLDVPILDVPQLDDATFRALRRRAIFDCCKWDPQVGDVGTLSRTPLVLTAEAWRELSALGEALARETLTLEAALRARPDLHGRLGLPSAAVAALRGAAQQPSLGTARLVRFDFHLTSDGWRISEANTDVPGGLNEASGFPPLVAPHYTPCDLTGSPADAYVDALLATLPAGARIALLHATAYSDDQQMMTYLAARLRARGAQPMLASPAHVRWVDGRAVVDGTEWSGAADALLRFFPADWLVQLPGHAWRMFFAGGRTPMSNPGTALLTQSKRMPLLWDALGVDVPTWRRLLPETRDPREVPWQRHDEWVMKPALGRVGEDVGLRGVVDAKEWAQVQRACSKYPEHWVAQRRFDATPVMLGGRAVYPCVGVYTVDAQVVGAYGRLATRALIDARAEDAAVLVERRLAS